MTEVAAASAAVAASAVAAVSAAAVSAAAATKVVDRGASNRHSTSPMTGVK